MVAKTALVFFGTVVVASATSVLFTFDTQVINGQTINGLSANASLNSIQNYMDQVLTASGCAGCTVSVTGAAADQTYNGEGYVVGPGGKSLTLGTSNNDQEWQLFSNPHLYIRYFPCQYERQLGATSYANHDEV